MNWQEVQGRARVFEEEQERKVALEQALKERETIQWERGKAQKAQQELVGARKLLEVLQVREVLEAIRDEVWKEGEVREVERPRFPLEFGLELVSNPYPVLSISIRGRNEPEVSFTLGKTSLEVTVLASGDKTRTVTHNKEGILRIKDQNLVDTVNTHPLPDEVKRVGLRRALVGIRDPFRQRIESEALVVINTDDLEGARNSLSATFLRHTDNRMRYGSLPADIRDWSESLIAQFPPTLRTAGCVGGRELREWGHRVRGTPLPVVLFDRLIHLRA